MENTNTNTISKGLSSQEQYILDNKQKYITLEESPDETLDITNELLSLTEKFSMGQMVHTEDFTLEETMNSVELDHFKMDAHFNYTEAGTYKKLFRLGKVKRMSDLSYKETLSLIDNLMIREMMWLNGAPIYQSIFNLVYFTEDSINTNTNTNRVNLEENLFKIYLDSTLQICYLTFTNVVECSSLREEDLMMIPLQNAEVLKRAKVYDELKWAENELKQKLKILEGDIEDRKIISCLLNRFRMRRDLLSIIKEQFDFKNKNRYENLILLVNSMKDLLNEFKSSTVETTFYEENLKLTNDYFSEKLCRVAPCISSIKQIKDMNFTEAILLLEKFVENLSSICKIYDLNDFQQILKHVEIINNTTEIYKPSFLIRSILELNLFPTGSNKLLEKIDYASTLHKNLQDFKINFLDESCDLISNLVSVNKEMLIKNLKNKARRIRDSNVLFEGLAFLVLEANHQEKEMSKNKKVAKRSVLTNLLLWQCLHQMNQHIWLCFELDLFSGFELDYVFYTAQTIVEVLCQNTNIIANSFAEKILREEDFVKSNSKKKLSSTQKMILDEIHIFNGLRCALKGMTLMCRYLKMSGMINNPQTKETEILRVQNRFPFFNHCRFFIDFSYESFTRDMYFELPKEKDMILQSADSYFKQSIKYLNELKAADIKLRDGLHYSNRYIENLSKAIICNNLVLSKIKKLDKKGMRISYTLKKYETFLPILEVN